MYGNCALAVFNSGDCIKIGRKLFTTIMRPAARIKKVIKVQDSDSFLDNYGKFVFIQPSLPDKRITFFKSRNKDAEKNYPISLPEDSCSTLPNVLR